MKNLIFLSLAIILASCTKLKVDRDVINDLNSRYVTYDILKCEKSYRQKFDGDRTFNDSIYQSLKEKHLTPNLFKKLYKMNKDSKFHELRDLQNDIRDSIEYEYNILVPNKDSIELITITYSVPEGNNKVIKTDDYVKRYNTFENYDDLSANTILGDLYDINYYTVQKFFDSAYEKYNDEQWDEILKGCKELAKKDPSLKIGDIFGY